MPSNYKTVINFRDGIQVDTDDLISNNGLVGIGSTIPRQQLDVRGNVIVSENTILNNLNVTGFSTYYGDVNVGTGYSVGIGTTVPEAAFQVGIGTTGVTITEQGVITGQQFIGDGSQLSGIPASVWVNPGVGQTIYSVKDVGIGTEIPRGNADFGVGYEIYMDGVSGVGTFEGIHVKNITVENTTGAGQGNVTAEVGTFSTVTATTSIAAPSFIGTITDAVRTQVAYALTDSPNIDVSYVAGIGATFSGITTVQTFKSDNGGVVIEAGIITATTFSGTATTALNATTAYSIAGDPDISVDKLTVNGLAPSIIQGSGISTIGQDLLVGNFIGVGNTVATSGDGAGIIGTVRISDGNLILGGSISIGGSLVGTVDLGGEQTINVLNVGAGLSVAGITTMTGDITGGGNFNITGTMRANEIESIDSLVVGGATTIGGSLVVGLDTAFSGSSLTIYNGGGITIGSGITMNGNIVGVETISAGGSITASGAIVGDQIKGSSLSIAGFSTIGSLYTQDIEVAGSLSVTGVSTIESGNIKIDGYVGVISAPAFYSNSGVSTFADILVTSGNNTRMYTKYVGVNTNNPAIPEGYEVWEAPAEFFASKTSAGIGIGTTSGGRDRSAKLYVGYDRDETTGELEQNSVVFETGCIGIGTTNAERSEREKVQIYRDIIFFNGHAGVGGTVGIGSTIVRVGWNTDAPGGALDMRYAGEPFCLPRAYTGGVGPDDPGTLESSGNQMGNMWYDVKTHTFRLAFSGIGDAIGIQTEGWFKEGDWDSIRGWHGPIVNSASTRDTDADVVPDRPEEEPVGWGTANVVYYTPTEQFQHKATDGSWRSHVGSATTGVEFIINGTTAILNVVGVGSISLGTLS